MDFLFSNRGMSCSSGSSQPASTYTCTLHHNHIDSFAYDYAAFRALIYTSRDLLCIRSAQFRACLYRSRTHTHKRTPARTHTRARANNRHMYECTYEIRIRHFLVARHIHILSHGSKQPAILLCTHIY